MREWKLYLRCLRHNAEASSLAAICGLGLMALLPAQLTGDTTLIVIVWGSVFTSFIGFIVSGAGADTFGQYLITRHTITSAIVRPTCIRISPRLSRSEQAGAELACVQFDIQFR